MARKATRKSLGNQTPTYAYSAPYAYSEGRFAIEYADAYGMPPHPWQQTILKDWLAVDEYGMLLNSLCLLPVSRQNGKALALDTEIPTPDGWKRMADIHVGDCVFGQDGRPSRVTLESETFDKPMYRVTFEDGASLKVTDDHIWTVYEDGLLHRRRDMTTADIIDEGFQPYRLFVPLCDQVDYPEADLPRHPYNIGYTAVVFGSPIPDEYLRSSVRQRFAVLDGVRGALSEMHLLNPMFPDEGRASRFLELCASLGVPARKFSHDGIFGVDFNRHDVLRHRWCKAMTSVERIPNEPSKCIAIDNPSHLYLAGRQYTATHNTGVCDPRETWGLVFRGEWILHTAQEFQTSQKAFNRLREKFGRCVNDKRAKFPELNALVERYTTSANQMVLDLTNGGHIEFRTRGTGGDVGRGGTFDLIVVDEAQSYTDEHDAALSPLNSAAPSGSPQTILMGTVPDPRKPHKGEVFMRLHDVAHDDPYPGLCIHEWGASEVGDVTDEERWYQYNPSLGFQLLISGLRKDSRSMNAETFAREHLGWWGGTVAAVRPIDRQSWERCRIEDSQVPDGEVVYAVKFDKDGQLGSMSVCLLPDDENLPLHVEHVGSWSTSHGLGEFSDTLTKVADFALTIVIDGRSDAMTLWGKLTEGGVDEDILVMPKPNDVADACSGFVNAIRTREVTHIGQEEVDEAVHGVSKRKIGNAGGYGFDADKDAASYVTIAESMSLAHWKAQQIRRNPPEEMRINL